MPRGVSTRIAFVITTAFAQSIPTLQRGLSRLPAVCPPAPPPLVLRRLTPCATTPSSSQWQANSQSISQREPKHDATGQPVRNKPSADASEQQQPSPVPRGDTLLLVGLGNPGPGFDDTRHNIGFHLVSAYAQRHSGAKFRHERSLQSEHTSVIVHSRIKVHILKPLTFMNNSGVAVRAALRHFSLPSSALLVVADDIALELGRLRLRPKGSAGGHNGLKSVQKAVGGLEYSRLKVGVGGPADAGDWADFVLAKFSRGDRKMLQDVEWDTMDVLDHWAEEPDINRVMNKLGMLQSGSGKR